MKKTVDIITMGCSKNLVDSEQLLGLFAANGFAATHDDEEPRGDIAIINTCGFIEDAKQESIDMILRMAQRKSEGTLQQLYVMGCMSERYLAELEQEIPEVDGWYGKFNYRQILTDILKKQQGTSVPPCEARRSLTTPRHYAYLKISEGCNRHCTYCAIPIITGSHKSRTIEEILDEVRWMVTQGVKEIQVIAQELTYYGVDIYGQQKLPELIDKMAEIPGVEWIRLHYAYPTHFPMQLLDVMRRRKNVCKYLDIALQHIATPVLQRMQRHITAEETYDLIETLRKEIPDIHLRTTMMVGFPGETEEDFEELIRFVKWAKFERLGAFAYSEEDGTYAAQHYKDDVPDEVKQNRLDRLMRIQQNISAQIAEQKVGRTMRVIIDRKEGHYYIARTEYSSPEVDPEVLIPDNKPLVIGQFYDAQITGAEEFDLYATVLDK